MPLTVTLQDVLAARQRIAPWIRRTPFVPSDWVSRATGARVGLKLESLQTTRAFKVRGAFNAALQLRGQRRLVTASTGNHGRGLSHVAQALGMEAIVFAPSTTPAVKLEGIRRAGATLITEARTYDEAEAAAMEYAAARGQEMQFLSAYSDERLLAATGTIALEILEDDPRIETIVVPLGGGGLIGGVALAAKAINPKIRVIGVEAAHNPAMSTARARGFVANVDLQPTLADAISGNNDPQTITFEYMQRFVDDIVLVSEAEIAGGIRELAGVDGIIAEGGGAVAAAALVAGRIALRENAPHVAAIVSGGNIDRQKLSKLLNEPHD
jgi:threonine dehydratase